MSPAQRHHATNPTRPAFGGNVPSLRPLVHPFLMFPTSQPLSGPLCTGAALRDPLPPRCICSSDSFVWLHLPRQSGTGPVPGASAVSPHHLLRKVGASGEQVRQPGLAAFTRHSSGAQKMSAVDQGPFLETSFLWAHMERSQKDRAQGRQPCRPRAGLWVRQGVNGMSTISSSVPKIVDGPSVP